MKTIKKYYAHFFFLGFVLFALTGAYFSTPMLPDVEIEFKSSPIEKQYQSEPEPTPVNKDIRNI